MQNQPGQYLGKDILIDNIPKIKVTKDDLGSTDTYHEEKILNKYLSYDQTAKELIYKSAIQLAIIGYGKKNYGFIRLDDKSTITLVELFNKYKIRFLDPINAKYNDDELSARRLLRLFRYQIQKFIVENNRPSYLWFKYADKSKLEMMSICFPGGEHLIETQEQGVFLLETYGRLDVQQNTKFRQRLQRVFIARGIFDPSFFLDKNY